MSKRFHREGRDIFYAQIFFEVRDEEREWISIGGKIAHRWLGLMSKSHSLDGVVPYAMPPLTMIRKLNIDLWDFKHDDYCRSTFNAVMSMPNLEKLVIDTQMTELDRLKYDTKKVHLCTTPQFWPGLCKLLLMKCKLRVFIPEHRGAQRWLQDMIDRPDDDVEKVEAGASTDWNMGKSPSTMVSLAVKDAVVRL